MTRRADGRWLRKCAVCGQEFHQSRSKKVTCSRQCAAKLPHNTGGRQPAVGLELRECVVCGGKFQPYRSNSVTCSKSCYRRQSHVVQAGSAYRSQPEVRDRRNASRRGSERVYQYNRQRSLARYGLTVEQHDAMLAAQNGLCAICGSPPNPKGIRAASRLHVDHNHTTGAVRELLCNGCNLGVGYFRENPALMRASAEYVERHSP